MFQLHRDRFLGWACLLLAGGFTANTFGGEVCGPACSEELPAHSQARIEHVRDQNGEPWKVLIVPRVFQVVSGNRPVKPAETAPAPEEAASLPGIDNQLQWVSTTKSPAIAEDVKEAIAATSEQTASEDETSPVIEPAPASPTVVISESVASLPSHINPHDYKRIYQAIPFVRSEYEANPSYRHEAAMEILFGQLRPQVNVKRPVRLSHASRSATPLNYRPQFRPFYSTGYYGGGLFRDGYTVLGAGGPFYRPWGIGYPGAYNTLPPYFSTYGGYGARRWLGWGY
ncbi:hypothetical protein [Thalassoroseus pseudoceratinae]|uniref:hypothetical protein n=1 Tax=Thalassoroseus pseudoceratinae TaxID=2713176 RepID=UPI0014233DEB|nr:hypothetical protein [Thalassoroseus pseudoceratinae]